MKLDRKKIEIILANKGWNQIDLAKESGYSRSQISLLLNKNRTYINTKIINRIMNALGVKDAKEIIAD